MNVVPKMGMQARIARWRSVRWGEGRILFAFLALVAALLIFAELASEAITGNLTAFDRLVITSLRDSTNPSVPRGPQWLNAAMRDLTTLGGRTALTAITAIVAGYLLVARRRATAIFLIGAVAGGAVVGSLLKMGFGRPRPDLVAHLVEVNSASFPSAHAMNSAIVYLTLGALLARAHDERRVRVYIIAVAIALALVIGFSRIYLGVHWPSDVLAGWVVGGTWAVLCSLAARALQRRRTIERASPSPPAG